MKVIEDAAQSFGGLYKGKRLGAIGDIGIYSFQINKVLTAGEGGAVVTNDPRLFERATRFHDLGMLRPGHKALLDAPALSSFVGTNYRMNEMTGAVMRAQLRKLEQVLGPMRRNAAVVRAQIRDLPGIGMRRMPDPEGDIGEYVHLFLKDRGQRDRFVEAVRAGKVAAGPPSGSLHLPSAPYVENKIAPHPKWPTFQTREGRAARYGPGCCRQTIDIYSRCAAFRIGPRDTETDLADIVAAIHQAHRTVCVAA